MTPVKYQGHTWYVNRHGVVMRFEDDPHFGPKFRQVIFPDRMADEREIRKLAKS